MDLFCFRSSNRGPAGQVVDPVQPGALMSISASLSSCS